MADDAKTNKANAQFNKLQRAEDGKKAMSEYEKEQAATLAKTARLKALRLARDAAEAAAPKKAPAPAKKKSVKAKKSDASLSEWLAKEKESGRNN